MCAGTGVSAALASRLAQQPASRRRVFVGALASSRSALELELLPLAVLGVDEHGTIAFKHDVSRRTQLLSATAASPSASASASASLSPDQVAAESAQAHGWDPASYDLLCLPQGDFLMPGMVDTHTHACQVPNLGLGQQYELLDWLQNVTFPREAKYADPSYARKAYASVVQRLLDAGTTTACYYASLHLDATKILAETCLLRGQRALVGKCQMNSNSPDYYRETSAETSMCDTRAFIDHCRHLARIHAQVRARDGYKEPPGSAGVASNTFDLLPSPTATTPAVTQQESPDGDADFLLSALVQPILTPRFAISCTPDLLRAVGDEHVRHPTLRIQTHTSENAGEIAFTKSLFPAAGSTYVGIYDHFGILTPRTVLAHAVHLDENEMQLIAARGCGVSHCPTSNMNIRSGYARVGEMLNRGIKVGLGTDVSGGYGVSILTAVRDAATTAKALTLPGLYADTMQGKDQQHQKPGSRPDCPIQAPQDAQVLPGASEPSPHHQEPTHSCSHQTPPTPVPAGIFNLSSAESIPIPTGQHDFTQGPLPISTLFFLATLGSAQVATLDDKIGSFDVGKAFDALHIHMHDPYAYGDLAGDSDDAQEAEAVFSGAGKMDGKPSRLQEHPPSGGLWAHPEEDHLDELVERFLFCGDDRAIRAVYVQGRRVDSKAKLEA